MDNEYEWGPWIDWNYRWGIPDGVKIGDYYQGYTSSGRKVEKFVEWNAPRNWSQVATFRIRKPRSKSMDILRALVQDPSLPINAPTGPVRELTPS